MINHKVPVNKWKFNYEKGRYILYRNDEPYEWFADIIPDEQAVIDVVDCVGEAARYIISRTGAYWSN